MKTSQVIAAPTLFQAKPLQTTPGIVCEHCAVVDFVGSHFTHTLEVGAHGLPRCFLGEHEGTVLHVERNHTTCSFFGDGPRGRRSREFSYQVPPAIPTGFHQAWLDDAPRILAEWYPTRPNPVVVEVEILGVPTVAAVSPRMVYHLPDQRVLVHGDAFPKDPRTRCVFSDVARVPGRKRYFAEGLLINSTCAACPVPAGAREGFFEVTCI